MKADAFYNMFIAGNITALNKEQNNVLTFDETILFSSDSSKE
jgi:hypothetical protein